MPLLTITTPEVETRIRLEDGEGKELFEDEIVFIDHMLSSCQEDVEDLDSDDAIYEWLPKFTEKMNTRYQLTLSETNAFYVAREAARLMWIVKKKYDSMLKLQESTE